MTEEIINSDGSRNWQANILLDNIKRLEQENENLKKEIKQIGSDFIKKGDYARELEQENKELREKAPMKLIAKNNTYRSVLEEINILAKNYCNACDEFKAKTYKNKNDCLYCNYGFIKKKSMRY